MPCGQGLISATSSKKISQIRSLCTESTWDLNYPVLLRLISTNCHQIVDSSRGKENYPLQTNTLWVSLVQMFGLINHRIIKHHTKIIINHSTLGPFCTCLLLQAWAALLCFNAASARTVVKYEVRDWPTAPEVHFPHFPPSPLPTMMSWHASSCRWRFWSTSCLPCKAFCRRSSRRNDSWHDDNMVTWQIQEQNLVNN